MKLIFVAFLFNWHHHDFDGTHFDLNTISKSAAGENPKIGTLIRKILD